MAKKKEMDIGKIVLGVILLLIAGWAFFTQTSETVKFLGAAILAVLGLASIYVGLMKK